MKKPKVQVSDDFLKKGKSPKKSKAALPGSKKKKTKVARKRNLGY